jgi:hypothetical protein
MIEDLKGKKQDGAFINTAIESKDADIVTHPEWKAHKDEMLILKMIHIPRSHHILAPTYLTP